MDEHNIMKSFAMNFAKMFKFHKFSRNDQAKEKETQRERKR